MPCNMVLTLVWFTSEFIPYNFDKEPMTDEC